MAIYRSAYLIRWLKIVFVIQFSTLVWQDKQSTRQLWCSGHFKTRTIFNFRYRTKITKQSVACFVPHRLQMALEIRQQRLRKRSKQFASNTRTSERSLIYSLHSPPTPVFSFRFEVRRLFTTFNDRRLFHRWSQIIIDLADRFDFLLDWPQSEIESRFSKPFCHHKNRIKRKLILIINFSTDRSINSSTRSTAPRIKPKVTKTISTVQKNPQH